MLDELRPVDETLPEDRALSIAFSLQFLLPLLVLRQLDGDGQSVEGASINI